MKMVFSSEYSRDSDYLANCQVNTRDMNWIHKTSSGIVVILIICMTWRLSRMRMYSLFLFQN